jgi:biopolymer transport protein ExbD
MKFRRAREYRRGRIEIIPMIDVMFFLLVTFMLASLSMQSLHSVPVTLPRGDAQPLQAQQPVTLTITGTGQLYLDKIATSLDALPATLRAMLQGRPATDVIVATDNAAPAGLVVQAMLAARRGGVQHFLIAVQRK